MRRAWLLRTAIGSVSAMALLAANGAAMADAMSDLVAAANPYLNPAGGSAALANLWNTNRNAPNAPTVGSIEQAEISLGIIPTSVAEWQSFGQSQVANQSDKQAAYPAADPVTPPGPLEGLRKPP